MESIKSLIVYYEQLLGPYGQMAQINKLWLLGSRLYGPIFNQQIDKNQN